MTSPAPKKPPSEAIARINFAVPQCSAASVRNTVLPVWFVANVPYSRYMTASSMLVVSWQLTPFQLSVHMPAVPPCCAAYREYVRISADLKDI